jgi:hypothetical protein
MAANTLGPRASQPNPCWVSCESVYRSDFGKICPRLDEHVLVLLDCFDDHIVLRLRTLTNRDHVAFRLTNALNTRTPF